MTLLLREECSKLVEETPASTKIVEEAQPSYSDDSFLEEVDADSSEETDRTPTFEFNLSPQSILVSGHEDSNENLPHRHAEDGDTASDASEIENDFLVLKEPGDTFGGSLQRKRSIWQMFKDPTHQTKDRSEGEKQLDVEKCHDGIKVTVQDNNQETFTDEGLNRIDKDVFGLLRSAANPFKPQVTERCQRSVVYAGEDEIEGVGSHTDTRNRKVRISVEPEVFFVPFSSQEFDEPFDDSFQEKGNFEPFFKTCAEDLDEDEGEGLVEDVILKERDEEDELAPKENGSPDMSLGRSTKGDSGHQIEQCNKHDAVMETLQVDSNDINHNAAKFEDKKEIKASQSQWTLKRVDIAPCSKGFDDNFPDSDKDSAEARKTKVNEEAIFKNINCSMQDKMKHKTLSYENQQTRLSMNLNDTNGNTVKEDQRTSWEPHGESFTKTEDVSHEDVKEEIPAESTTDNFDDDDNYEPCDLSLENDAVKDGTETGAKIIATSQLISSSNMKDTKIALEDGHSSISGTPIQTVVTGQESKEVDIVLVPTSANPTEKPNDQTSSKKVAQEDRKTFLTEDESSMILCEEAASTRAVIAFGDQDGQDLYDSEVVTATKNSTNIIKVEHNQNNASHGNVTVRVGDFPGPPKEKDTKEKEAECPHTMEILHEEIDALKQDNEELKLELDEKNLQIYTIECMIQSANLENENLLSQIENMDDELQSTLSEKQKLSSELSARHQMTLNGISENQKLTTEIKDLRRHKEQLELHLEESKLQLENMESVVEQLNYDNEKLLEEIDGLKLTVYEKRASEIDENRHLETNESLKSELQKILLEKQNLESTMNAKRVQGLDFNEKRSEEVETFKKDYEQLALHLEESKMQLKNMGTAVEQLTFENEELVQNINRLEAVLSEKTTSEVDLKRLLETSARDKEAPSNLLKQERNEHAKCNEKQIMRITTNDAEKKELLERIYYLEKEVKAVLNEKHDVEKQLKEKNSREEYRERELSNLKENMVQQKFSWEEMETALDQLWNDKEMLQGELDFSAASLEESEVAKADAIKELNGVKLQVEKLRDELASRGSSKDYAYLREEVEHLTGLLSLSCLNEAKLKKELDFATTSGPSFNTEDEIALIKEQYKTRTETLERENALLSQKLECGKNSKKIISNLEKMITNIQQDLRRFRDESSLALRDGSNARQRCKKLRQRLILNDVNITSLTENLQRETHETKVMNTGLRRQVQNDVKQIKEVVQKNAASECFVGYIQEIKGLVETTLKTVQKNNTDRNLDQQKQEAHRLDDKYQELKCKFDINEIQLKGKDKEIKELKLQLHQEKESNTSLKDACGTAEIDARQRVAEKDSEISRLRELLEDSDGKVQRTNERLEHVSKDLKNAKEALAQRGDELAGVKASLFEGENLLNNFKKSLTDMKYELEHTKRGLLDKSVALDHVERYSNMLFKVVETQNGEILMTNQLINTVVENVDRVGNLLEGKLVGKKVETLSKGTTTDNDIVEEVMNESTGHKSLQKQFRNTLKEKDDTIQQLQASLQQIKQDLAVATSSLGEKEDALKRIIFAFESQGKELEFSNERTKKIAEEVDCFHKEMTELNTLLSLREDDVKKLKELVTSKDSQLKEQGMKLEEIKFQLHNNENALEVAMHDLAQNELEKRSLMDNLKNRVEEIRHLKEALDEERMGKYRSLDNHPGTIAPKWVSGKSEYTRKELEFKECKDKEEAITCFEKNDSVHEKNEELANTRHELRKKEFEIANDTLLRQMEQRYELQKRCASENESSLRKETKHLEKKIKELGTLLCRRKTESEELTTSFRKCEIRKNLNDSREVERKRMKEDTSCSFVKDDNEKCPMEIARIAGKQIASTMADRMHEIMAHMHAMQVTLESQRSEYCVLTNKNKDLKERLGKLEDQVVKKDIVHSERLNNVLDNVRIKRNEIKSLKAMLRQRTTQMEVIFPKVCKLNPCKIFLFASKNFPTSVVRPSLIFTRRITISTLV